MNRLLFLLFAMTTAFCSASDETLARGVPGTYSRSNGMYSESLTLRADGSYSFSIQRDLGRDEESGTWTVRDTVVQLAAKKRGETVKQRSGKFLIVAIHGDLALRVMDGDYQSWDELEPGLLFHREKRANQALEPTSGTVTPRAGARGAPVPPVAHL